MNISVYSDGAKIPLDLAVGQTIQINWTTTDNSLYSPPSVTTRSEGAVITFNGYEDLTIAGRAFLNTCKLTDKYIPTGKTSVVWLAKGFGPIRSEELDEKGVVVPGSRKEISAILAAP
ncbi:hypothetical protein [Noviherbaspirillum humi]|uniref:hypothetical protein n=1 Tax=Noviherbaspirillum humi TaxID=1688639 RepID=UPI0011606CB0|nr:hypothetical protein [Noviherbaspirillum humi]